MGTVVTGSVVDGTAQGIDATSTKRDFTVVSYNPGDGRTLYRLTLTASHLLNGPFSIVTGDTSKVRDDSGNEALVGQAITAFNFNIATPADTTPPIAAYAGAAPLPDITIAGPVTIDVEVIWTDPA